MSGASGCYAPAIICFDVDSGQDCEAAIGVRDVLAHRRTALATTVNDTSAKDSDIAALSTDAWDETATLVCALQTAVTGAATIVGAVRVARSIDGALPFSDLYGVATLPGDVEIGRTTILRSHRGGLVASMLAIRSIRFVQDTFPGATLIYSDPVLGGKRGVTSEALQAMGFAPCTDVAYDPRYDLSSQLHRQAVADLGRYWAWRAQHFGPDGPNPSRLIMSM